MDKQLYVDEVACKWCGSSNAHINGVDELEFNDDGTGHVDHDHYCSDCGKGFRSYTKFKYEIVSQTTS